MKMYIYRKTVISNASNQKFINHPLTLKCFNSSLSDESYQFNEKLIKKIKSSQLFNAEYRGIKRSLDQNQQIKLSTEVQRYLPSVSKVISETMTEENTKILEIWKAKMIKKLGLSGFQNYQKDIFSRGSRLHKNIEYKLRKNEENIKIDEDINGYWTSLQPILNEINDVHLIETKLTHPILLYRGIVDCVAQLNQVDTVVDWKTSEKVKDTKMKLYDAPIQTVAYLGALNQSDLLDFEINRIAVVISYKDGRVANYHQMGEKDCETFWHTWTQKLMQYWTKVLSNSPADPCLLSYFDDLLALSAEKHKSIHHFNRNESMSNSLSTSDSECSAISSSKFSKVKLNNKSKKHKTKEELVEILRNKTQINKQIK